MEIYKKKNTKLFKILSPTPINNTNKYPYLIFLTHNINNKLPLNIKIIILKILNHYHNTHHIFAKSPPQTF